MTTLLPCVVVMAGPMRAFSGHESERCYRRLHGALACRPYHCQHRHHLPSSRTRSCRLYHPEGLPPAPSDLDEALLGV